MSDPPSLKGVAHDIVIESISDVTELMVEASGGDNGQNGSPSSIEVIIRYVPQSRRDTSGKPVVAEPQTLLDFDRLPREAGILPSRSLSLSVKWVRPGQSTLIPLVSHP